MHQRVMRLREKMSNHGIDALLVNKPENRRYLSGFAGSTANLLIAQDTSYILTDFRYVEQAKEQCPDFTVVQTGDDYYHKLKHCVQQSGVKKLGFETDFLTHEKYDKLTKELEDIQTIPVKDITEGLRMIKDAGEIELICRAVNLADDAWGMLLPTVKPGITEIEVSLELEFIMRRLGAQGAAFEFIVASGPRGAMPHGVASDREIKPGDMVTIDFGAVYKGYRSDITRNFVLGQPQPKQLEIYNIVLEAQLEGIRAVKPGVPASHVDDAARKVIEHYGYGQHFGHGTGHGVGLAIHEGPKVSVQGSNTLLQPGMVITIEPGIYLPGWGGVRIEDMVLVTENGYEILTGTPKDQLPVL